MKKMLYTFGLATSLFLPALSVVSCSTNPTVNSSFDSAKWVEEFSTEAIIKEESFENIVKRIQKANFLKENVTEKEFEQEFKQILNQELIVDKDSKIYEEIVNQNKLNEFESSYVDEAYKTLIEEIKEDQGTDSPNTRHWDGFFSWHTWQTIRWSLAILAVNILLPMLDIAIQVTIEFGPAIYSAYKGNFIPLINKFINFKKFKFSKLTQEIVLATISGVRNWQIRTKCRTGFKIWGVIVYEV